MDIEALNINIQSNTSFSLSFFISLFHTSILNIFKGENGYMSVKMNIKSKASKLKYKKEDKIIN